MGGIEKIIDLSNKNVATKELGEYFDTYSKFPSAAVACPGGAYRSWIISIYLAANNMAMCPLNFETINGKKKISAIDYRDLWFTSRENGRIYSSSKDGQINSSIDVAVLCDDPERNRSDKIDRVVNRVAGRIPILLLEGMEGNFVYFCQRVTID
ncbi:MAG: hypothetical protein US68_C0011G0016 [Candidatus Shapirobacteria bacterium GW2011_GWE1_38_10]|uniref:Uncharacterized protein n=1 Tax=Candidatus Shapirobacteria bacterium GW2011_GWE1_38_10 TaxID=1618488 RepID=A0A0G0KKK6_9BACT|nr:MAG: hypothetical protein US46_C0006G0016 [Candidatus Shapirobacteria bacterium GW2011_GWF2_37_20]KKQ49709.1 MAG: hypothetical protein US68_C0011G0016 [Candidatus Shapirobacteria bacterium GW2011_GWE1_38_10]KKQ64418.1 MAG: hypothetical protein US85_C0009G0007 [Candidatus Shapirobacteria bacterium GW2011_GWF1_38_23]HBP51638.1 hypothetical protein [Candidatus Shapirobacteria bacterium]